MKLDYSKISNVHVVNINVKDWPDLTDAFIESADYDGREMTEEELELLNEDHAFVHEHASERVWG